MTVPKDILDKLKPFTQHGVRFAAAVGTEARGTCPFCPQRAHKHDAKTILSANADTHAWKCHSCGRGGGLPDFFWGRCEQYAAALGGTAGEKLALLRGVSLNTLRRWDVGFAGSFFSIPVRAGGKVVNIHRYDPSKPKGKQMLSTTGGRGGLMFGDPADRDRAKTIYVCEGEWDAMVLDEVFHVVGQKAASVGVPGAGSSGESLALACQGKAVVLCFDHDKPGADGDSRAREVLQGRVASVQSVHWPDGYADGYDVRDLWLAKGGDAVGFLRTLRGLVSPDPVAVARLDGDNHRVLSLPPRALAQRMAGDGMPRDEVVAAFRKWLYLPDPEVIDVVFGTVLANRLEGDPLWLFVVGPSGCGKNAILMSLYGAPLVTMTTTMTPAALISGAPGQSGDPSLIPKLDGQVLVIKDFTTILSMRQDKRDDVLGILRDAYDGRIEKHFGIGEPRKYESKFGIIAGVTNVIERIASNTASGERFLKYCIRSLSRLGADRQATRRALKNRKHHAQMRDELAAAARAALDRAAPGEPDLPDRHAERIVLVAEWTARMRGAITRDKYTREMVHKPSSGVGTRIATQFDKLAAGVAAFRGRDAVGPDEMSVVAHAARDSAPDIREEIVRQMYIYAPDEYKAPGVVAEWCGRLPDALIEAQLADMAMLGIVEKKGYETYRLSRAVETLTRETDLYAGEKIWHRVPRAEARRRKP